MRNISPYILRVALTLIAFVLVLGSALYSNSLAARLRSEEQKRMEIWAEATRRLIVAQPDDDLDFYLTIIENNTTIPVYMTDAEGNCILYRNVSDTLHVQKTVDRLREKQQPMEVLVGRGIKQYIYYENSTLLTLLTWFPYINITVVLVFLALALLFVFTMQEAEQDRVWAGLSKETAHQLGTPISSLNAWHEILKTNYPDDQLIPEMEADLHRLTTIADRFSKVGSTPELVPTDLYALLSDTVAYMRKRTSGRVEFSLNAASGVFRGTVPPFSGSPLETEFRMGRAASPECFNAAERQSVHEGDASEGAGGSQSEGSEEFAPNAKPNELVLANPALLSWVIENLLRNAVDAMDGAGQITITLSGRTIDIADTGKGIPRRDWHRIFLPGYTTKERGWGMGLSLCRRIIRTYHHGRIFVLRSSTTSPTGTTFRIEL